jgi:hypothetical protein
MRAICRPAIEDPSKEIEMGLSGALRGMLSVLLLWQAGHNAVAAELSGTETVRQWGLLGTWAVDCSGSPSLQNNFISYVVNHNEIEIHHGSGDLSFSEKLRTPVVLADGNLQFEKAMGDVVMITTMAIQDKRRLRMMQNFIVSRQTYGVKDGKRQPGGSSETPWLQRCENSNS